MTDGVKGLGEVDCCHDGALVKSSQNLFVDFLEGNGGAACFPDCMLLLGLSEVFIRCW